MATVAQFNVDLLARTQGFRREMTSAARVVQGFGRTLAAVRAGVLGFVGFGGLQSVVSRSLQTAEQIQNLSIRFGESSERLGRLRQVSQEAGLEFNTVTTAVQRLARRTADAAAGNESLRDAFEQLGINVDRFFQLSPIDQFAALANALQKVGNQGERIRLAFKLVDSEGVPAILRFTEAQNQLNKALAEAEAGAALGRAAPNVGAAGSAVRGFFNRISGFLINLANELVQPTVEGGGTDIRASVRAQRERFATGVRGQMNRDRTLEEINETGKQQLRTLQEINNKAGGATAQ